MNKEIDAGELDKYVLIGNYSKKTGIFTQVRECWSKINNTTAKDIKAGSTDIEHAVTRFLVRYTDVELSSGMYILYNKKLYNIEYVQDYNENNEFIEILASYKGIKINGDNN